MDIRLGYKLLRDNRVPIRAKLTALGIGAACIAVLEVLAEHWFKKNPTGWTSLMAAMLLLSGTQLLLLGILGEYVGRIYLGISEKPQSVVRDIVRSVSAN